MEHQFEIVLLGVLVAVIGLLVLASWTRVPYPILLVLGGLGIAFVPGVPAVELEPNLVLLIFLPPLLYGAAFFSSLRDLRANLRPISLLSIGLVLATVVSVAVVAHAVVEGLSWPAAFVLGAIVSPTDPVAATAIAGRLGVPRRIVTIVEGESLINDGTGLVLYRVAIAAVVSGSFSLWETGAQFLLSAAGGVAVGVAVGFVVAAIRGRLDNPLVEITISLFTAYFAYLPAEAIGASGVLAAVTVGVWMGWRAPRLISPSTRIRLYSIWDLLRFLLNSTLFILIGLQLPTVLEGLSGEASQLALYALVVVATVTATRLVWVFVFTYVPRWLSRSLRRRDPDPPWQSTFLVGWMGMRGAVSLAAALALPEALPDGAPFPGRDLIVFLTFCVIVATVVGQGLSLPPLIRALRLEDDDPSAQEELEARLRAAEAAIRRIDEIAGEEWVRDDSADRMRGIYDYRRRRFATLMGEYDGDADGDETDYEDRTAAFTRMRTELLRAERDTLLQLRNEHRISDEVLRRVERDLDLEEARLEG